MHEICTAFIIFNKLSGYSNYCETRKHAVSVLSNSCIPVFTKKNPHPLDDIEDTVSDKNELTL